MCTGYGEALESIVECRGPKKCMFSTMRGSTIRWHGLMPPYRFHRGGFPSFAMDCCSTLLASHWKVHTRMIPTRWFREWFPSFVGVSSLYSSPCHWFLPHRSPFAPGAAHSCNGVGFDRSGTQPCGRVFDWRLLHADHYEMQEKDAIPSEK